jgi:hypothetical protein
MEHERRMMVDKRA